MNVEQLKKDTANNELEMIVNHQPKRVKYSDYLEAKAKALREFGYPDVTFSTVSKVVDDIAGGLTDKDEAFGVIHMMVIDDLNYPDQPVIAKVDLCFPSPDGKTYYTFVVNKINGKITRFANIGCDARLTDHLASTNNINRLDVPRCFVYCHTGERSELQKDDMPLKYQKFLTFASVNFNK